MKKALNTYSTFIYILLPCGAECAAVYNPTEAPLPLPADKFAFLFFCSSASYSVSQMHQKTSVSLSRESGQCLSAA